MLAECSPSITTFLFHFILITSLAVFLSPSVSFLISGMEAKRDEIKVNKCMPVAWGERFLSEEIENIGQITYLLHLRLTNFKLRMNIFVSNAHKCITHVNVL